jgi:hypothetical protein
MSGSPAGRSMVDMNSTTRHFIRHYVEMIVAMFLGMAVTMTARRPARPRCADR